jgi:dienelactone hydrolase
VIGPFWRFLDWLAIQFAASRMPCPDRAAPRLEEAERLVNDTAFLAADAPAPGLTFAGERAFSFTSPLPSPYEENNIVPGRVYRAGADWRNKPAVILVHGWNDAPNHYYRFPKLAQKINHAGMSAVTMELPYHFRRRPRQRLGAASNFLSADILRTAQAAGQAVAELRAMTRWLKEQGCPKVGLLGVSLGGWLGGLAACHEPRLDAVALVVPATRLDRAIQEAAFCKSIHAALGGRKIDMGRLNLLTAAPQMGKENVLLVEAEYDCFVPKDTVEELCRCWGGPEIWRFPVGHVTVFQVPGLTRRLVAWLERKLDAGDARQTGFCQDNSATAARPPSSAQSASS